MGFLKDVGGMIGAGIGVVGGLAVAPVALALGVSVEVVKEAIKAGCKTIDEVREFLKD
jgi:hypothetical protein